MAIRATPEHESTCRHTGRPTPTLSKREAEIMSA